MKQDEILRKAAAALEEQNSDHNAIQIGINEMEQGRYRPFGDFDGEFREQNQVETKA